MPPERFNYKKGYILPVNNKTPQYCEVLLPAPSRNQVKDVEYIKFEVVSTLTTGDAYPESIESYHLDELLINRLHLYKYVKTAIIEV